MADIVSLGTNPYGWLRGTTGSRSPDFTGQGAWNQVINLPPVGVNGRNLIGGLPSDQ